MMKKQTKQQQQKRLRTEEIKEDVEIRRLIEERRNTPKEEKQQLKEVSTCINKCIRDKKKNEKATGHPTNTRRLQTCKEHPRNQIFNEKSVHHLNKE